MTTKSSTIPLRKLYSNSKFTIPEIQRDYAWDAKKQITKLLEDLWKYSFVTKHETCPQYFLGTVIFYSGYDDGSLQIMDGQQRITTLTALMAAIKIHFERLSKELSHPYKAKAEALVNEIEDDFLFVTGELGVAKLQPKTKESLQIINLMISSHAVEPSSNEKLQAEETSGIKIIKCLEMFYKLINKKLILEDNAAQKAETLQKFYKTLRDKVVVTRTQTDTMGMAFQMFVSVNGISMPLNNYDLLRGLLVAKSHELGFDQKVTKDIKKLTKTVKGLEKQKKTATDAAVDNAVTYWMEARQGCNIPKNNVPSEMEKEISSFDKYIEFKDMIQQLIGFIENFTEINTTGPAKYKGNKLGDRPDGWVSNRRILGFKALNGWNAAHSILYSCALYAQKEKGYKKYEVIQIMRAVEWLSIRCFDLNPNKLEEPYPWAANKCIEGIPFDDWFDDFIEKLESIFFKSEIHGFSHLSSTEISESKATVLLHIVSGSTRDPGPRFTTNVCNAARLLPLSAPSPWRCKREKEEHGSISNLLGNWFLMKDTDGDIKKYTTDPLARAQQMKKSANTTMETTSLSEIVNGIKQNPSNYSPIKDIQPRNRNLIEQLEAYWPKEFKKK